MKNWRVALGLLVVLFTVVSGMAQQRGTLAPITVIEGATVIDGVSGAPIEDAVLVIEGDTIRQIGKRGSITPPSNAQVINARGKTIIPGMVSLHAHLGITEGWEMKPEHYNLARIQRDANAYLYYGITHVVSLGVDWEPMQGFRSDQRSGKTGGARAYSAGLGFSAKNGWEPGGIVEINRPTTPEEARDLVRKEMQKQVNFLKIWLDDRQGQLPKLSPEVYWAIIDEAHKNNVKVLVHLYALEDAKEIIRRGVDALAHSVRDREVDDEFLRLAKDKKITQITTLVGHYGDLAWAEGASYLDDPGLAVLFSSEMLQRLRSPEYRQERANNPNLERTRAQYELAAKNAKKIAAAGIAIAIGTDSGGPTRFPGLWEHREMELLARDVLTPMQAIQAATINGARFLGVEKRYGSLEPGKAADFIVLNADPLADITNSRKIEAVWMNGKVVDRAALGLRQPTSY